MPYEPRTIALHCELIHPPLPMDPRPVQQIHNELFQSGNPPYTSFAVTPMGPVLSNPDASPGRISQVLFLPDQIQFREEQGPLTHEHFARRVETIAERFAKSRGVENYAGQRVTVRALVSPQNQRNAKAFLDQALFAGRLGEGSVVDQSFGQSAALYGLRLAFEEVDEPKSTMGLRVESYTPDARSLFIEIQGTYGPLEPHLGSEGLGQRVRSVYHFLEQPTMDLIANFDRTPHA
ncbi:MAG: hypothetical protein H6830_05790 [Planctomycetes bacterium]|nr:hypothetical protein [Planctomycetota bacterium]MCB9909034.1 hypothetical protein [Planctomycetota bacterium]MCB9911721.1 hypothetical protein [Planctomycetota bacterium]HRV80600.1 hypothetical protein [Planctomycetota bacterium]